MHNPFPKTETLMPTTTTRPAVISPREMAEALGMSKRQMYRWIYDDEVEAEKIDGQWKVTEKALAEKVGADLAETVFDRVAGSREPPTE